MLSVLLPLPLRAPQIFFWMHTVVTHAAESLIPHPRNTTFPCSETMAEESPRVAVRDVEYFLEPIFILVEDTIFQVPKYHVTQISIFSTIFSLPPQEDGSEGLTEKHPLILHQISKCDFKAFLKVLIPLQIPQSYSNITTKEWVSTLKLSTMWEFTILRDLAIRHLNNSLEATEMILLGAEYRVSQWFINGCAKFISRSRGPTEDEGDVLGMRVTVQIYGLREQLMHHRHTVPPHVLFDCQRAVRQAFPDKIFD